MGITVKNKSIKEIDSSFWFKEANAWLKICYGYNNPLNLGNIHSELRILEANTTEIFNVIKNDELVFLGVGVGDTEIFIVDIQLEKFGNSVIHSVDINSTFLQMFSDSLNQRLLENNLFNIKHNTLNIHFREIYNSLLKNIGQRTIVVLGSTIGNYNKTQEFFEILSNFILPKDKLLIGYQMNNNIEMIYEKYAHNKYYPELIGNFLSFEERKEINWLLNSENSAIEAWFKDIQLFRSKKFSVAEIENLSKLFSFKRLFNVVDKSMNISIEILEKV